MKRLKGILLVLCILLYSSYTFAQTNVSGIYFTDTTWTVEGSPYYVIGYVHVSDGVTLTVEPGVEIQYTDAYEILIQGIIVANGTEADSIIFTSFEPGISSEATMLRFTEVDLTTSQLSYIRMEYANRSILIGDNNTGTLTASHLEINEADVITGGYDTGAILLLSDAIITSSTIKGNYPRSEVIIIQNAVISDCNINSDSYNHGITIQNSNVTNSQFTIGCCGANIHIESSNIIESSIYEGGGSPVVGPLELTNSKLINTSINLPAATVDVSNSIVDYNGSNGLIFGNGLIEYSQFKGNGEGVAVQITGLQGYNVGGSVSILHSTITQNSVGIQITNANIITFNYNNIFDNTVYNVENLSGIDITATYNYWGTSDPDEIAETIFDYYDDINYGIVDYSNYLDTPDTDAPVSSPNNVIKSASGSDVQLLWQANPESDLAGYKVYYGSPTGYSFDNVIDVGNVTSYTLSGVSVSDTIAVTAYDIDADGNDDQIEGHESWFAYAGYPTGVEENLFSLPKSFYISQNYPNPFNPETTISFSIPKDSKVEISIYNVKGQKIKTLTNENLQSGYYKVIWNGKDENDKSVSSGIYFYKMETDNFSLIKKCILLK